MKMITSCLMIKSNNLEKHMFIYDGIERYTIKDIAIITGDRISSVQSWYTRSGVEGIKIPHDEVKFFIPTYRGRKGVVAYTEADMSKYVTRFSVVEARTRGIDIHQRTMKVDYIRDEPRSYQARYIKAISADGFVGEFAVESGRIDAFYCDGKTAHIVDFKTGGFGNYSEQMNKYVKDIRIMFPTVEIITHVIYTDQWETEVTTH